MKNILLIGVGGTGSNAVDILNQQIKEFGQQTENHVSALVFDTDVGSINTINGATTVPMSDTGSVGTVADRIGTKYLIDWFPCKDKVVRSQELVRGASQWRKKSFLAFMNLMNKPVARATFINALEKMIADPRASCELYVVASIAGGTGSGSFIPIALYAKQYLRKHLGREPLVNAMIALPDIYESSQTPENKIKIYSNAYAILRELNAINCVAYGSNNIKEGGEKHAPIKMRIGHPDEPNVGLLFDSEDKRFWTPEAAPFNQVFVLDRIPGLKSIVAHDIVMANSLYTLICTEIGAEFDSEASNHAILHSQSNGSNAIYAGISTSQIRFPKETILDYIARNKAVSACDGEWMVLHRETEKKIREKIQLARNNNEKYVMKDGEYASLVLEVLEQFEKNNNGRKVLDMVSRGTTISGDGKKEENANTADRFFEKLGDEIASRITGSEETYRDVYSGNNVKVTAKSKKDAVARRARLWYDGIETYYEECINTIKRSARSMAESILSFDDTREERGSLLGAVLCDGKRFIHPVAAMVQLCRIKCKLAAELEGKDNKMVWDDLKSRSIGNIPEELLTFEGGETPNEALGTTQTIDNNKTAKRSAYFRSDDPSKFIRLAQSDRNGFAYFDQRTKTDVVCDAYVLDSDAGIIITKIHDGAVAQFKYAVYSALSRNVDLLIEKYRNFFSRFEKEKEAMAEETRTLVGKDVGIVDSVINVYCAEKDKNAVMKEVFDGAGQESDAQVAEMDDIAGRGVFEASYRAAVATCKQDENWNDKDTTAYHSLFDSLIAAYHDYISKTDVFQKIAEYNVVQALEAGSLTPAQLEENLKACFSNAQELAQPSLKYNMDSDTDDLIMPTVVTVFMMSTNTARYIKRFADRFGLHLPADRNNERTVVRSCAEEFIHKYAGSDSARISIVDTMPDNVLYCTGEIMDISPLRIPKFDECSTENTYFKYYREALRRYGKFGTDMWNPHLGYNFHSHGHLPYINPQMENECDKKMVKALIWAFRNDQIVYGRSGMTYDGGALAFRYVSNGRKAFIMGADGNVVRMKNIAQLMVWLRNSDELVEQWSARFEEDLQAQLNALPNIADDASTIDVLESTITKSPYMKLLQTNLFRDPNYPDGEGGPGLIELALRVRTSEESAVDCDDAEKILEVAYDIFLQFCGFRADRTKTPECFIQVYRQQLNKLYEGFAKAPLFRKGAGNENTVAYYKQVISWMNDASLFLGIPTDNAINERFEVSINKKFNLDEYPDVRRALNARDTVVPMKAAPLTDDEGEEDEDDDE